MVKTWTHGKDFDSWCRLRLMVLKKTHGIDFDLRYRKGLMVWTKAHGVVWVLLNHTCTRGPRVTRASDFLFVYLSCNVEHETNYIYFSPNRPTGPIQSSSRDVCLSVCVFVPFPCDSPRGAKEVPGEQSHLPPWHQYPEKMLRLTIGPQST